MDYKMRIRKYKHQSWLGVFPAKFLVEFGISQEEVKGGNKDELGKPRPIMLELKKYGEKWVITRAQEPHELNPSST